MKIHPQFFSVILLRDKKKDRKEKMGENITCRK